MEETLKQRKIALAQSEHYTTIVELMKDCTSKNPIIADTEFKTLVNAITLEVEANMMMRVVDYIEDIRKGILHEQE
jgi:hypothetical protein